MPAGIIAPLPFFPDAAFIERFWSHVDKRGSDECWPWTGCIANTGHGRMAMARKPMPAHRLAHSIEHRKEIHFHSTPATVATIRRAAILPIFSWAPGAENTRDNVAKGRHARV